MIEVIGFVGLLIVSAIIMLFFNWLNNIVREVREMRKPLKEITPLTSTVEEWEKYR
tara:strand:- start:1611 stop:1778 length:168 start_codon:yes stop_codon:yes gene_type:complete